MQTKKIISISLFTLLVGFTNAGCRENYCRKSEDEMFIAAEQQFKAEIVSGTHNHPVTTKNLCDFHLSSIAYGFSIVESGKGKSRIGTQINNRFSVKKGSGTYQYQRKPERGFLQGSRYLKYPDEFLSTLDFMYLFKYGYACKFSFANIAAYKTGRIAGDDNTKRYYNNLLSSVKYFEKKYFGSNEKLENYKLINMDNIEKTHAAAGNSPVAPKQESKPKPVLPLTRNETKQGKDKYINISINTNNDSVNIKIKQGTKYAEAIKKTLKGKYTFKEKITLIKRILDLQKKELELTNYKKDILVLNKAISQNTVLLNLNKSRFEKFYSVKIQIPQTELSHGYSLSSNESISDGNIVLQNLGYKELIKIISLNMVLGFYRIVLG